jgi:hypothetical protein
VLSAQAAADDLRERAVAAVEAFVAAWNEDDGGSYRDAMANVSGRDELAAQIAAARVAASGASIALAGPVLHSHDHVDRSQQRHPRRGQFDGRSDPSRTPTRIFTV